MPRYVREIGTHLSWTSAAGNAAGLITSMSIYTVSSSEPTSLPRQEEKATLQCKYIVIYLNPFIIKILLNG